MLLFHIFSKCVLILLYVQMIVFTLKQLIANKHKKKQTLKIIYFTRDIKKRIFRLFFEVRILCETLRRQQ